jgi:hypothetical protein
MSASRSRRESGTPSSTSASRAAPSTTAAPATPAPAATTQSATSTAPTAAVGGAPSGGMVSTRPTSSPAEAGHNPNVIIPRAQMTQGQRRALERHNADAIAERDRVVGEYLRSVLPPDEGAVEESQQSSSTSGEQPSTTESPTAANDADAERDQIIAREQETFRRQFGSDAAGGDR